VGCALCYFCGEAKYILLDRRLRDSLPREACYDKEPCDACRKLMQQGVMFIEVVDGAGNGAGEGEPERTGRLWVLRDAAVERWAGEWSGPENEPNPFTRALRQRVAFIPQSAARQLGLQPVDKAADDGPPAQRGGQGCAQG